MADPSAAAPLLDSFNAVSMQPVSGESEEGVVGEPEADISLQPATGDSAEEQVGEPDAPSGAAIYSIATGRDLQPATGDGAEEQAGASSGAAVYNIATARDLSAPIVDSGEARRLVTPVVEGHVSEDLNQTQGEDLTRDPLWPPGCCWWLNYCRFHNHLVRRAREIMVEDAGDRQRGQEAAGQADVTIGSSIRLLRKEVFSLCPMNYLISGILISIVLTATGFFIPYVQGVLVDVSVNAFNQHKGGDKLSPREVYKLIFPEIAGFAGISVLGYVCEVLVGILFAIAGHTTVTRLRIKLFRNLLVQEIAFYDSHVSGELSSRLINDSAALASLTQFTTQSLLGAVVKFVGSLVAMFYTHPTLALIATVITPLNTWLVRLTGATVGHYGVVQNHAMAKANAVAIEVLGNIRTVHSNVGEVHESNVFMQKLNYYLRVIKATVYLETVLRMTFYGLAKLRNVVVLAYAMYLVIEGDLTIGSYTAFAQYVSLYEDGFKNMADIWINFRQTITSTGKFVQLLLREPEISLEGGLKPESCNGEITFEKVEFRYKTRPDNMVLKGIDIHVVPGNTIALVGESGAGKTTVGRMLQRYYDPTGGRILLDGRDFKDLDLRWLRSQIGTVEQEPVLFDRPIHENIAYGTARGSDLESIKQAVRLAHAEAFVRRLESPDANADPNDPGSFEGGLQVTPGERAARISGGQKQRIAIARAIVRNPKVLLLDEATSALDSETESIVQAALDNLMIGKTTFIIAHRLSTIVRATKILVLDKGLVMEEGTHDELVSDETTKYSSFMRHQIMKPLFD